MTGQGRWRRRAESVQSLPRRIIDGPRPLLAIRTLRSFRRVVILMVPLFVVAMFMPGVGGAIGSSSGTHRATNMTSKASPPAISINSLLPIGVPSPSSPSGLAPPGPDSLSGYQLSYVTDFSGVSLPQGWSAFTGVPTGGGGSQWASSHVVVSKGTAQLNTFLDPQFGGRWVSGGLCQCDVAQTYGAYFVRSRMTGPGATQVEMLWPASGWPPEVDFSETYGGVSTSMATDHFSSSNQQIHTTVSVDMTKWHTWGVIWTPSTLTYVLDGQVWGVVNGASQIPNQPMSLHIQAQTWCAAGWACPTTPQSSYVDWVAEYVPANRTPPIPMTIAVGPFPQGSSKLTVLMKNQLGTVANQIRTSGYTLVSLIGYGDRVSLKTKSTARNLARTRDSAVAVQLRRDLVSLNVSGVTVNLGNALVQSSPLVKTSRAAPVYFGHVLVSLN